MEKKKKTNLNLEDYETQFSYQKLKSNLMLMTKKQSG